VAARPLESCAHRQQGAAADVRSFLCWRCTPAPSTSKGNQTGSGIRSGHARHGSTGTAAAPAGPAVNARAGTTQTASRHTSTSPPSPRRERALQKRSPPGFSRDAQRNAPTQGDGGDVAPLQAHDGKRCPAAGTGTPADSANGANHSSPNGTTQQQQQQQTLDRLAPQVNHQRVWHNARAGPRGKANHVRRVHVQSLSSVTPVRWEATAYSAKGQAVPAAPQREPDHVREPKPTANGQRSAPNSASPPHRNTRDSKGHSGATPEHVAHSDAIEPAVSLGAPPARFPCTIAAGSQSESESVSASEHGSAQTECARRLVTTGGHRGTGDDGDGDRKGRARSRRENNGRADHKTRRRRHPMPTTSPSSSSSSSPLSSPLSSSPPSSSSPSPSTLESCRKGGNRGVRRGPRRGESSDSSTSGVGAGGISNSSSSSDRSLAGDAPLRQVRLAINFIKSVLIGRYVQPRCAVMDLGCGRGQDVTKLAYSRPHFVLFVDIAEQALAEAERRWQRKRFAYPAAFLQDDFCAPHGFMSGRRVVVHCDDPRRAPGQQRQTVVDHIIETSDGADLVDAVSCQFTAQCAFWSRESAAALIANVRRVLRPGGVFLGIVPDGCRVWDAITATNSTSGALVRKPNDSAQGESETDNGPEPTRGEDHAVAIRDGAPDSDKLAPKNDASEDKSDADQRRNALRPRQVCIVPHGSRPDSPRMTEDPSPRLTGNAKAFAPFLFGVGCVPHAPDVAVGPHDRRQQMPPVPETDCGPLDAHLQYTVMFDDLCGMCTEAGLTLLTTSDLLSFYDMECINPRNAVTLERMHAPVRLTDADDRHHMGLYRLFVFVRVAEAPVASPQSSDSDGTQGATTTAPAVRPSDGCYPKRTSGPSTCTPTTFVWSSGLVP